ncbi:MAG TPA: glycosyltransferase family 4 protein [Candidatus Saccharimonadales bacterium]|jgi:phosphatidylinositol alpha-mannosyltransferase|nr:glycosyltransferase family 4 protein [Candidatus Saccharimonadales bacterium]
MATKAGLKIGLVLDTSLDTTEGVPQYVIHIGEWLRSQGHEVHYLVGETKRRDLPNIHSLSRNIAVSFNGSRTTIPLPTSRRKLRRFMQQHSFDVLHVQTPHHPLMAQRLILAANSSTAVVGTFHILPYGRLARAANYLLGLWLRPSLRRFDKMLAVSTAAADFCRQSFGIKADISPNVVNYQLFQAAKPLKEYGDRLNILFLGRLVERKGCQILLEAVTELLQEPGLPAFRVIICGKGPLDQQLKQYAQANALNNVEFAGFVSEADKPRYYASADLAVFPSRSGESFGIVLLEAMASGHAAVLAGDNPGYRSVMSAQPDLLFPAQNARELAYKLRHYLTDSKQRAQMARWGARHAKSYDVNVVGPDLVRIYQQALRKRRNQ